MERFITIFAWIMAIPATLYIMWFCGLTIIGLIIKAKIKIHLKSSIGWIIFAACWAWILSR